MESCSYPECKEMLSLHQLEATKKLYGKPYCIDHEKYANEEAAKAAERFTINVQPYTDCGWKIDPPGVAAKTIGQVEVTVDITKVAAGNAKKFCISVGEYEYEFGVNPDVDAEIKKLFWAIEKNGAGKVKKEQPAPQKEESKPQPKEPEVVNENLPAKRDKKELIVGTCEAVAVQYGIPKELANLFFMKMNEGLYIKNPGLLYLAGKKGYSRIEITDKYDEKAGEWSAECKIYPKMSKELLEGISKLDKEMQKNAFDFLTNPTNGTGRASKNSVKMSTMQPFLREMAQTRAQNRALRAFTGYGGTSVEELPEGHIED